MNPQIMALMAAALNGGGGAQPGGPPLPKPPASPPPAPAPQGALGPPQIAPPGASGPAPQSSPTDAPLPQVPGDMMSPAMPSAQDTGDNYTPQQDASGHLPRFPRNNLGALLIPPVVSMMEQPVPGSGVNQTLGQFLHPR